MGVDVIRVTVGGADGVDVDGTSVAVWVGS